MKFQKKRAPYKKYFIYLKKFKKTLKIFSKILTNEKIRDKVVKKERRRFPWAGNSRQTEGLFEKTPGARGFAACGALFGKMPARAPRRRGGQAVAKEKGAAPGRERLQKQAAFWAAGRTP